MKKHYRHEQDCLNCGSGLHGKFCHNCGQENLHIRESFGHMINHAVSDYFHFDHQFFHTLKPLLLKPGQLTIEYMNGRRAQYLHPVKMYIFISLVYFLLLFKTNHEVVKVNSDTKVSKKELTDSIKKALDKNPKLTKGQKATVVGAVDSYIPENTSPVMISTDDDSKDADFDINSKKDSTYSQYLVSQQNLPAERRDNFWIQFYHKKKYAYTERYGKHAGRQFVEDINHNVPKMMFVLLPLFALILKITFRKNHKYYVEHLIYTIHLHCFVFLFAAIILFTQLLLPHSWHTLSEWLTLLMVIYTAWYVYRSLRVIYHRSHGRTISKMFGMGFMYLMFFGICMAGLAALTAVTA